MIAKTKSVILCLALSACGESGTVAHTGDVRPGGGLDGLGGRPADASLPLDGLANDAALDAPPPVKYALRLEEIVARNDGVAVDELGATTDLIELVNADSAPASLDGYTIGDRRDRLHSLPALTLQPGETVVFFADDELADGPLHLPFRLSGEGESVFLFGPDRELADVADIPALVPNFAFARIPSARGAFVVCAWATPGQANGDTCGAPPPPELPDDVTFAEYEWPEPWPHPPAPLVITEISLRPAPPLAPFVELLNTASNPADLSAFHLTVGALSPGSDYPGRDSPQAITLGPALLGSGERIVVSLSPASVQFLDTQPAPEGFVSLWAVGRVYPVDRHDFVGFPSSASLARLPDATGFAQLCRTPTPGEPNAACDPLPSRELPSHARHLRTPSDYATLAEGGTSVGIESVKFLVDLQGSDAIYFLGSRRWDLHYTFVREVIDGQPHLNRCDPIENRLFYDAWSAFSQRNYFEVESRRYLLGTLVHYGASDLYTVEFTPGDLISAEQMRRAFFAVMARVPSPQRFALRPTEDGQVDRLRQLEGRVPIVGPNAPFRGLTYQPLTQAVGYGVLTYVAGTELSQAALGEQVIVVTDQVPNDLPFVGGLVTEAFQTPLAHVNLLSRNRGTPNMALRSARTDPRLAPFLGKLVQLDVSSGDFSIRLAEEEEAIAFWASRRPMGEPLRPRLDVSVSGVQDLTERGFGDLPFLGGKASQFAELYRVNSPRGACLGPLNVPTTGLGVPIVHSLDHFAASGATARRLLMEADPAFLTQPEVRAAGLAEIRALVLGLPVEAVLLEEVEAAVRSRFGTQSVRFRSSSNTEDLEGFNGAGLYTSISAAVDDPDASIEDAIRSVWASLWNQRGYDERAHNNVDQSAVGMGILIHEAFPVERVNGVAISRNVLEPLYRDHFVNAQHGEASVTNPAPGVSTEQYVWHFTRPPNREFLGRSSLRDGTEVMSFDESAALSCALSSIHDHFRPLVDPTSSNRWFAMDIEFKLLGDTRTLLIKQARPYSFGHAEIPADCREF